MSPAIEAIPNAHGFALLLMLFLPLIGGLVLALLPAKPGAADRSRVIALATAILTLLVSLRFLGGIFDRPEEWIAGVRADWIASPRISFLLGMDGLSGLLVLLTNILVILSILGSWTAIAKRQREFYFFLLLLQTGILGTFLALDLIVFYIFWELMLIPLYFLIGIFGSGNRIYATLKFFLYTMVGSVLMLVGILALYFQSAAISGVGSFALPELMAIAPEIGPGMQMAIFVSFFIAFAIKVPLFPVHTWLPDAHTEAPTAGSVILAGVLLKTGVYGLMRFAIPLFPGPADQLAPAIVVLSLIAIIYGALTAFAQSDMKRLVAYSSVSHMGFIVLGLFAFREMAVTGASLQMLNHGISTGGLFLCVGYLYERRHTRELSAFGGLAYNMKVYAVLTVIMVLSSVGLPGLNGFVGEFLILLGAFQAEPWWAVVAATGVILAACYLLRMVQLTFYGPLDKEENKGLSDLNAREAFTLVVLAVLAFWMGLYPKPFTDSLAPSSRVIVEQVAEVRPVAVAETPAPAPKRARPGTTHDGHGAH